MKKSHFYYVLIVIVLEVVLIGVKYYTKSKPMSLLGINFVIDPGHGGKDNGACYKEVLEDEINLNIARKVMNMSINDGAISSLTRTDDYDLSSENAKNHKSEDLKKRVDFINSSGAQFFVSIHMNCYPQNELVHGPMVYYEKNNEFSKLFAENMMSVLNEFSRTNKKVHSEDFYLFRNTEIPGILIECGFISNKNDRNNLSNDLYQQEFAKKIYEGIESTFISNKI